MKLTDDQSRMLFHSMKTRVVEEHAEYVQKHNADWVLDNTYSQCVIAKHAFLHDLHTELRGFVEQRYHELERRGDGS